MRQKNIYFNRRDTRLRSWSGPVETDFQGQPSSDNMPADRGNQNISFLPAIMSTCTRMHGEFLRLLFLQAHRETEAHFTATGMSSHRYQSDSFRFKRAAFYQSLKSKVGLAAATSAALRINLNVVGCSTVARVVVATMDAGLDIE